MIGLRQKQKEERRDKMLGTAMSLFRRHGYESVKLEEIAQSAGVSAGTVYGYFKTKNDLLLAVVVNDFELGLTYGSQALDDPVKDAVNAINQLTKCHYYYRKDGLTLEMWRFAVAAFLSHPDSHFSKRYEKCLLQVREQYVLMVQKLQALGYLPETVSAEEVAKFLDSIATVAFLDAIRKEPGTEEELAVEQEKMNARLIEWIQGGTQGTFTIQPSLD